MLKLKSLVVFPVTLLAVQTYCFSGLYDVNEVRYVYFYLMTVCERYRAFSHNGVLL